MNTRLKRSHAGSLLMVALAWAAGGFAGEERDIPIRPWTLSEALAVLELQPDDVYLQFAALQLGRREGKGKETEEKVRAIVSPFRWWAANERREDLDLFNLFTGALAVQESLQFDTLRSAGAEEAKEKKDEVKLSKLKGPEIKSHPWTKMLNGRKPEVSALSRCVPSDFFLAEFRSVNKLLDAQEVSDLWGAHFFNQAEREAHSFALGPRIRRQLVLETSLLLRPVYDMVVEEVALTGSDLFLREGSDLTLLFKIAQPELFKARMDGFMANARQAHPEGVFEKGEYNGVAYEHFTAEGRERDVYAAYPEAGVHIRSNSLPAFQRVVDAVLGKGPDGKKAERLGDMEEFAFIRTLMPRGAKEEDGFVYLSDPFIREQVGPRVKLTERRRILCYNRLRMIGHAALLFRTEHGRAPASLDEVIEKDCLPRGFGKGESACLDGGVYGLSTDGAFGTCSCHGHARFLTPCGEIEIKKVTKDEAEQYERFIKDYEQYWRMYFDPIALRVQITPQRYRMETIILPLLDNSIYTGLARMHSGEPVNLDPLPVPKRNIFSVGLNINKDELLKMKEDELHFERTIGLPYGEKLDKTSLRAFFEKGIGSSVSLHVCDAVPTFDLNFAKLMGECMGSASASGRNLNYDALLTGLVVGSINTPTYLAVPVQDAGVVDQFLADLDKEFARTAREKGGQSWWSLSQDFYRINEPNGRSTRCVSFAFTAVKWRAFWERIGNTLYVSSRKSVLDDLWNLNEKLAKGGEAAADITAPTEVKAHAMLRVRPQNWNEILADYRLGWAENNRLACLKNLGPISNAARGMELPAGPWAKGDAERLGSRAQLEANRLYTVYYFCPEGGHYLLNENGKDVACSVHGSALHPTQAMAPDENRSMGKLMQSFAGMTAALTFMEDGLHAVVTLDRK